MPQPYWRQKSDSALLSPHKDYILRRLAAVGFCAQAIYEELRVRGYAGSYDVVKRFASPLRAEASIEATVRFETPPGRQAQADWGQCWTKIGGKKTKIHIFVMTLGYSRRMFAVAMRDERLPVFLSSHEATFSHLGGIPHEIVYDNLKSVVLERNFEGSRFEWNPVFLDFSRYYGFQARPHRPQTKGKVESGIKYVKRFLRGKFFESLDHLNACLLERLMTVADQGVHGTTHRKPAEMFLEEKSLLHALEARPAYILKERAVRHVFKDCLVAYETNRYSVPYRLAGKRVEVQADGDKLKIYHDGELNVSHARLAGSFQSRMDKAHYWGIFKPAKPSAEAGLPGDDVQIRDLAVYESLLEGGAL